MVFMAFCVFCVDENPAVYFKVWVFSDDHVLFVAVG